MISNNFLSAFRNLVRHKRFSILNFFGLTIGFTAFTLIVQFVIHEFSYDRHFRHANRIFRIITEVDSHRDDQKMLLSSTAGYLKPYLEDSLTGVEGVCRMFNPEENFIRKWIPSDNHPHFMYADASYFRVFSPGVMEGDPATALTKPFHVALTRKLANRIGDGKDLIGSTIHIHGRPYQVDAVLEEMPGSSHLQFDLLISFPTLEETGEFRQSLDYITFILFDPGAGRDGARERLVHCCDSILNARFADSGLRIHTSLQALRKIHLNSGGITNSFDVNGSLSEIIYYLLIALLILSVAVFNFINLHTANTIVRTREIAMRKILGADRESLRRQFRTETGMTVLLSLFLAIGLTEILKPGFSHIMNRSLELSFLGQVILGLTLLLVAWLVILPAANYPLRHLERIPPIEALSLTNIPRKQRQFRSLVVMGQFMISFLMVSSFLVLDRQLHFLREMDMGYSPDNLQVYYKVTNRFRKDFSPLRDQLLQVPGIANASASDGIPGIVPVLTNYWEEGESMDNALLITENRVRDDFIGTFGIDLLEGRNFDLRLDGPHGKFILNETAARMLGIGDDPLGKVIHVYEYTDTVIGIVHDFYFSSPEDSIGPLVLTRYASPYRFITIKEHDPSDSVAVSKVNQLITSYFQGEVFGSFMMKDLNDQVLEKESRKGQLILWATLLSMIISMFGLYAHTSFMLAKKSKEIGIRKAFGSISLKIFWQLSGDLLKWVFLSLVVAIPLAYLMTSRILTGYTHHVHPTIWILILAAGIVAISAYLSVFLILWLKSRTRAVQSLRYE